MPIKPENKAWYQPWATVYDGGLPWRGSFAQAKYL